MKKRNAVLLSTPYLIWMVLFTLIPLGVVVYYALTDPSTGEFSFVNIRQMGMYLPVLWSSILYSLVSAVVCLIIGYPVAYYIAHCSQTAQRFLYMLVMLPMCMSFLLRTLPGWGCSMTRASSIISWGLFQLAPLSWWDFFRNSPGLWPPDADSYPWRSGAGHGV